MLWLVFRAFGSARFAYFGAERTKSGCELAAARHELGGENAEIGAIAIQFYAPCHLLHILLVQTFRRAVLACCRACVARVDTALVFLVWHIVSSGLVHFLK